MIQDNVLEILLFIVCVLLSAFFSSSEVGLISITRAKVRTLVNENRPGAKAVAALKESLAICDAAFDALELPTPEPTQASPFPCISNHVLHRAPG